MRLTLPTLPALPPVWSVIRSLTERQVLVLSAGFLFCIGLIMVGSASMGVADAQFGNPFYFFIRHLVYLLLGLMVGAVVMQVPMEQWRRWSPILLLLTYALLMIVLVAGRRVNGSKRWLGFGPFTIQPSEIAKFVTIVFLAGYLVRRQEEVRTRLSGLVKLGMVVVPAVLLLLMEPDMGASVVLVAAVMFMFFLAGAPGIQFVGISGFALFAGIVAILLEPYRLKRVTTLLDPWADQYGHGYQLVQSLIAVGRGDWFGVGLGHSVQKLFYLPEAHTDFVFAVYSEEFGLVGILVLMSAVAALVFSSLRIGQRAEAAGQPFSAYVAYGFAAMLGIQSAINIGVNLGLFPTKGLTLPLVSYGGTSLIIICCVLAVLLRIEAESGEVRERGLRRTGGAHVHR